MFTPHSTRSHFSIWIDPRTRYAARSSGCCHLAGAFFFYLVQPIAKLRIKLFYAIIFQLEIWHCLKDRLRPPDNDLDEGLLRAEVILPHDLANLSDRQLSLLTDGDQGVQRFTCCGNHFLSPRKNGVRDPALPCYIVWLHLTQSL